MCSSDSGNGEGGGILAATVVVVTAAIENRVAAITILASYVESGVNDAVN